MFSASGLASFVMICRRIGAVSLVVFGTLLAGGVVITNAQAINEDFATVASNTGTPLPNWVAINHSASVGSTGWYQGDATVFPAQAGAANSYIAADYNSTTGANTISDWLLVPNVTFTNGDTVSFYTRTTTGVNPDRLQVRLSTNGASTNVGTLATDVGDFSTLLLDINPTYTSSGYPIVWTKYTITISGLSGPTSGRLAFRYFVENGGPSGANSDYIGIDTFVYTPVNSVVQHVLDFNGDGMTDYSVVRSANVSDPNSQLTWLNCYNGVAQPGCYQFAAWGITSDIPVPADYDGDGKTDIAIFRPFGGTVGFYILQSATSTVRFVSFGQNGDDPSVVADYTGDGHADPAVYRGASAPGGQSYWFYLASSGPNSGQLVTEPWGTFGDLPAPGDYDGDGKADFMIQRDDGSGNSLFILRTNTTNNVSAKYFGLTSDYIVPGDYDGDGKTDIAVVRNIGGNLVWFYLASSTGNMVILGQWGVVATDTIVQGDYDGDGKTDMAIWRANPNGYGYFYVLGSKSGFTGFQWGLSNGSDYPVANYNVR